LLKAFSTRTRSRQRNPRRSRGFLDWKGTRALHKIHETANSI
jgi:hypothetical protein